MSSSKVERKLAAIMFTDIAGYTEQMSKDEDKAFALIQKKRDLLLPLVEKHEGKLIKEIGDGTLTRYFKADNAIDCASIFQAKTDTDLNVRAGIHTGEVIVDKEDVFGDVVNVASRLESIAVPGSILVSKETIDKLEMSNSLELVSLGMQSLKGVGRLIEVYAIKDESLVVPNPEDYTENKIDVHSDDEVPSIAIIPFENKGKEEDVFYAYGISADLISDCSSAGLIRVSSLSDIEKLDYTNLDNTQLSQKLFVRYVSQGVLWKMGEMFQLSVELYDTKDKKVVWSDRWQEKWDNLPTIKINLSDGLLKALDTTSKVEKKTETTNTKAYEFYLKAKHKYEKRENTDDTEIARGLLNKAIELDDNLISAKVLLGWTYSEIGNYDKAMEIYTSTLKQAEELGDKREMGSSLSNIGTVYSDKGDYDKALDYYERSLKIDEELGDKRGMGSSLNNIGIVYYNRGDYDKALDYYGRSLAIQEELGDKSLMESSLHNIGIVHYRKGDYDKALDYYGRSLVICEELGDKSGMGYSLMGIGNVHSDKGDYDKALNYYGRSLAIREELGDKFGMGYSLMGIGNVHNNKLDYKKAEEHLEKSLNIQKEIGVATDDLIWVTTYLYLTYKHLGKDYDVKEIHSLIKDAENIEFELNLRLYELLEDTSYLEAAFNQVQEKASAMENELAKKFLSYPIPKAIVEEWEKVK